MKSALTGHFTGGQGLHRSCGAERSNSHSFIFRKDFIMVSVDPAHTPGTVGARQDVTPVHHTPCTHFHIYGQFSIIHLLACFWEVRWEETQMEDVIPAYYITLFEAFEF